MWDLVWAVTVLWGLSACIYLGVVRKAVRLTSRRRAALTMLAIAAAGLWFMSIRDHAALARLLPFSALIILANWLPLFCAIIAALSVQPEQNRMRRFLPTVAMTGLGVFATLQPLLGARPSCHDTWDGDVCLQSSSHSCSAACAATLLRHYRIVATESEMVDLCLTRKGTTWQGLYRGLFIQTEQTQWRVEVTDESVDELEQNWAGPVIISVGIPVGTDVDPIYTEQYGWPAGLLHSVVLFGWNEDGLPIIADPSVGMENWSREDLAVLYRGTGIRLVSKSARSRP